MLVRAAYIFLLRLPSEALPMARVYSGDGHSEHSGLCMLVGSIYLRLARQKIKPSGSLLTLLLVLVVAEDVPCPRAVAVREPISSG